jgi:hypothetical protein
VRIKKQNAKRLILKEARLRAVVLATPPDSHEP